MSINTNLFCNIDPHIIFFFHNFSHLFFCIIFSFPTEWICVVILVWYLSTVRYPTPGSIYAQKYIVWYYNMKSMLSLKVFTTFECFSCWHQRWEKLLKIIIKKSVPIKFKCFPCFWFVLFVSIDIKGCPNRRDQHKDITLWSNGKILYKQISWWSKRW